MAAIVSIYFGCGCFWHIQHELIQAERSILSRTDDELTTLAGYGGGTGTNSIGTACYPYRNRALGDHELHHAEVVGLQIPRDRFSDFAEEYWRLFVGINRVDVMDLGPEYRAVIGLPGGMDSELLAEIEAAQTGIVSQTFELREGVGGDADTLGQALVWVYDTDEFPFYQAETYHQFHDDFMGPTYPQAYNDLNGLFVSDCRMESTGCWDDPITQVSGCPEVAAVVGTNPAPSPPPASSSGGSGDYGSSELIVVNPAPTPPPASSHGGSGDYGSSELDDESAAPSPAPASSHGGSGDMDGADVANTDDEDESAADDQDDNYDTSATSPLKTTWLAHGIVLVALISGTRS